MQQNIISVSTKGQLVIPAEMRETLGIVPGSRVAVTLDDGALILRPVTERLVDETCGMLAGQGSLADELQQERRAEKW